MASKTDQINSRKPLNPKELWTLPTGHHGDTTRGLVLVVRKNGERRWAFRFTSPTGERALMEFGKPGEKNKGDELTLSEARNKALEYRLLLKDGTDPRFRKRIADKMGKTFLEFAEEQYPAWCVGCHPEEEKQWKRSIADMEPLHELKLHEITTDDVLAALKTFWETKQVTADRTRQRLERLFEAAKVLKLRTGDNPAAWRGNLKSLLPSPRKLNRKKREKLGKSKGHASVPYEKAPALMTALRYELGNSARCVEAGLLTVTRSQEIRLMEWDEIDFGKKQWMIPAKKMKIKGEENAKPHLVPLSDQAIELIKAMPRVGRYVFPSDYVEEHQPFYANALSNCIKRCGFKATMHGMRTTFRNWGGESVQHNFRREVLEHCLSHRVGDESELSYWTAEMVERRRIVLQAWADYVLPRKKRKAGKPSLRLVA